MCILFGQLNGAAETPERRSQDPFFNTRIVDDPELMEIYLGAEGYGPVEFYSRESEDSDRRFKLNGMFLDRGDDARFNVLLHPGFYPGRKTGMATFHRILPEDCCALTFDNRGHGQSEGPFFLSGSSYGLNEYHDATAAIRYLHEQNGKPVVCLGICSGAFHLIKSLAKNPVLDEQGKPVVAGLIIDGAWNSLSEAAHPAILSQVKKALLGGFSAVTGTRDKHKIEQWKSFRFENWLLGNSVCGIYDLFLKSGVESHDPETRLDNIVRQSTSPMPPTCVLHAADDTFAPFENVRPLWKAMAPYTIGGLLVPNESSHGTIQFKHPEDYIGQVDWFCQEALRQYYDPLGVD